MPSARRDEVRARRVLHPRVDETTAAVLRRPGGGGAARRHRAGAARPPRHPLRSPGYRRTIRRLDADRRAVAADAADPAAARAATSAPTCATTASCWSSTASVAFTGSQNIIDPSYNKRGNIRRGLHWQDLMVRFEGPVVAGINALFVTDWYSETDELLLRETRTGRRARPAPSDLGLPGRAERPRVRGREQPAAVQLAALRGAGADHHHQPLLRARRVDALRDHHRRAARRSTCELFVSEIGDQVRRLPRAAQLLRGAAAGRRADLPVPAPTILHAKHFTIDDRSSVIGSSNMDMRSFSLEPRDLGHGARRHRS